MVVMLADNVSLNRPGLVVKSFPAQVSSSLVIWNPSQDGSFNEPGVALIETEKSLPAWNAAELPDLITEKFVAVPVNDNVGDPAGPIANNTVAVSTDRYGSPSSCGWVFTTTLVAVIVSEADAIEILKLNVAAVACTAPKV